MQLIACLLCWKTGLIQKNKLPKPVEERSKCSQVSNPTGNIADEIMQCPLCGVSARKHFNIPTYLKDFGWTTKEAVNSYYTKLASEEAEYLALQEVQKRQTAGEIKSNSQKKKLMRTLSTTIKNDLLSTKYKSFIHDIVDDE
jgi:hypothetical protein